MASNLNETFSFAHECIIAMLSIHPLNQTPRWWNAFVKNRKIGESTTVCGSVLRADSQAETTVFNATHTALNQQSWTWELSPVEAQGWGSSLSLFPIRWFRLKSLKVGTAQKMLHGCAYAVSIWFVQNPASCAHTDEESRFSSEKEAYGGKNEE